MTARCPSDLALEGYLLEPQRSPVKPHLDGCEPCQGRLARMQQEGDEFRRYVFPATVDAIQEAAAPRRSRWATLFAPIAALAAVGAAALLVVRAGPSGPGADYVGIKGKGVTLGVYVGAEDGARPVDDGGAVPAAAALRFKVNPAAACRLWIVSVDGAGEVSRLFPAPGAAPAPVAAGAVPGGAVLDGQPGPERLFAVCAGEATSWDDVRRAAAVTGGPDQVRRAHGLGAPLADAPQASVLLEKTR